MARQDFYTRLVYARQKWPFRKAGYYLLKLLGSEIPVSVPVGPGFILEHGGHGVVVHSKAKIGANVHLYQGVTLGRADIYLPSEQSKFEGIEIGRRGDSLTRLQGTLPGRRSQGRQRHRARCECCPAGIHRRL